MRPWFLLPLALRVEVYLYQRKHTMATVTATTLAFTMRTPVPNLQPPDLSLRADAPDAEVSGNRLIHAQMRDRKLYMRWMRYIYFAEATLSRFPFVSPISRVYIRNMGHPVELIEYLASCLLGYRVIVDLSSAAPIAERRVDNGGTEFPSLTRSEEEYVLRNWTTGDPSSDPNELRILIAVNGIDDGVIDSEVSRLMRLSIGPIIITRPDTDSSRRKLVASTTRFNTDFISPFIILGKPGLDGMTFANPCINDFSYGQEGYITYSPGSEAIMVKRNTNDISPFIKRILDAESTRGGDDRLIRDRRVLEELEKTRKETTRRDLGLPYYGLTPKP